MTMAPDLFDVTGKVILVTGASSGLGRHFATMLARRGALVALAARRLDPLQEAVYAITENGGRAMAARLDVTEAASCTACFAAVEGAFGPVDVLVNNSGVTASVPSLDLDEADWDRILDTNLKGAWLATREFGRRARTTKRGGAAVNVASILGLRVAGHVSAYAASKAALLQLTAAMALELARYGIRVNALAPATSPPTSTALSSRATRKGADRPRAPAPAREARGPRWPAAAARERGFALYDGCQHRGRWRAPCRLALKPRRHLPAPAC